jgi:hypothetical protein
MLKWFVGALALLALACGEGSNPSAPVIHDGEGLLELPLVSTSAGRSYKLVGATFAITGPRNVTITDTSADSVSLPLTAGAYSIQLNGDWHVERTDAPGVAVAASLVSPNPMAFALGEGETRSVRFLFKVSEDGTVDVGIGVDTGGWISGTIQFESRPPTGPGGPEDIYAGLAGKAVPFVISYESVTVFPTIEYGIKGLIIKTSPVALQFGGSPGVAFQQRIVAALEGRSMTFVLKAVDGTATSVTTLLVQNLQQGTDFAIRLPVPFYLGEDADGYPLLRPKAFSGGTAELFCDEGLLKGVITTGTFAPR